ncbi:eCIS core domain-containing protein [Chitinophaga ginsengisegetis]|uniref:eCIS core domain-containing protein n=1 Tax=Chitinophaga ginsengisegetis TaxID=393003 RepID=UPI000DB93D33|nr:DUF4157 domain-containing protein [Chitinophaga ginsengisegetis]MDR6570698.1 hypothetical protein [Chitinophaga ginsengisegetis]MDR6650432.1 hypothetical protein [Chitinophaga ginsengisegetis]MDR6656929.1 hypothetical protein [Chitinophaga ginsengisegetis]
MSHENQYSGVIHSPSSAAAYNHSISGISKPAVQPVQRASDEKDHEEDPLQMRNGPKPFQLKSNNTGLPDNLKSGIENLSGYSMDDVNVHYNSGKPSQLQAHAFAQGTDIHLASGQEKHLPHEAWHVVQQKQGRVTPTMQLKGKVNINNDSGLEKEADEMGQKAVQLSKDPATGPYKAFKQQAAASVVPTAQLMQINGVDVTESSKLADLKLAIGWSPHLGITKPLKDNEKTELLRLIRLLKSDDSSVSDIVEDLEKESSEEEEDGGYGEGFGDEAGFGEEDFKGVQSFSLPEVSQQPKRRQTPEEFGWENFPETYKGLKKLGVHETDFANLESLVAKGPAVEKVDSANHIGKGRGFYVTPVGKKKLATVVDGIVYGDSFVAIYIKSNIGAVRSPNEESNHTAILDKEHGNELCYYIMSGGGEIVIPERCFPYVKAVSVLEQLHQIREEKKKKTGKKEKEKEVDEDHGRGEHEVGLNPDHQLALAIYNDEVDFVRRLNKLSDDYNSATSVSVKKRIRQRWMFLEARLFNRWQTNGRQYTLWLDVRPIGTHTDFPPHP